MDTGKYFDLGIGLAQSALGVFLAWRAFVVTLKVPTEAESPRHKAVFLVCCIAVIVLAGVQTFRNFGLDRKLDKIEANTEKPQPAPIVNVAPPMVTVNTLPPLRHTTVNFNNPVESAGPGGPLTPFHVGQIIELNMIEVNTGDFPIRSGRTDAVIVLTPITEMTNLFQRNQKKVHPKDDMGALNAHLANHYTYMTYIGPTLTQDDVNELNAHRDAVCMIGAMDWTDDSGNYRTDMSQCFVLGATDWHQTAENNREHKLR